MAAFASLGFTSAAFSSFDTSGLNNDNQIASNTIAVPFSGRPGRMHVYFAGNGASTNARLAVWQGSNGGLVAKSNQFTAPSGAASTGGQSLQEQYADGTEWVIYSTDTAAIGFWRDKAASSVWSVTGSGTFIFKTDLGADITDFSGGSGCAGPFVCGNPEMWCDLIGGDFGRTVRRGYPAFVRARR